MTVVTTWKRQYSDVMFLTWFQLILLSRIRINKISVTQLSEYRVEKYYSTFSKSSRMVLQYIVSCTYKGCSHLTRPPPPNSTRGQRKQIYVLSYHMPWKRTWNKFYTMALSYQYHVTYGRSPYCHFIKLLQGVWSWSPWQNPNYNRRGQRLPARLV